MYAPTIRHFSEIPDAPGFGAILIVSRVEVANL